MSDNLIASTGEIRIGCDEDRARRILVHGGKRRVDLSFVGCPRQLELQAKRASGCPCVVEVQIGIRIGRVHEDGNGCSTRYQIVQQRQPLCHKHIGEKRDTGDIGGRVIDAPHKAEFDRVAAGREDDRNASGRRLGRLRHGAAAGRVDHSHLSANEIARQRKQQIMLFAAPAIIDCDVLALGIAGFAQALVKRCQLARR